MNARSKGLRDFILILGAACPFAPSLYVLQTCKILPSKANVPVIIYFFTGNECFEAIQSIFDTKVSKVY